MAQPTDGSPWQRAARLADLEGEGPHAISVGGVDLVAVRTQSGLKVWDGVCPHRGALLGEGELDGRTLVCRNHRWKFDAETGQRLGGRQCLRVCPAREQDGELYVDVSAWSRAREQPAKRRMQDLPGPKGIPWLGNALQIDPKRLHLQLEEWAARYGGMFFLRAGPRAIVAISDPELAESVLRARPDTYRRVSTVATVFEEMSAKGVFSAEGDEWRAQRRLAMVALSHSHLRGFYPTLETVASRLVRRWDEAADAAVTLDIADELKRFTVDVTTHLVFGYDINTIEERDGEDVIQRDLEVFFPTLHRRLGALVPYWRWIRLPADYRVERATASIRAWIDQRIASARARLAEDRSTSRAPQNFLEAMLLARDSNGAAFSDDVLFGNSLTMLLAGEDTTAYTLAWAVHHLCDEPRATDALRAEAATVLGDLRVPRELEQAARLSYATAVANEAMRLRPVAPLSFVEPVRDVVIGDTAVPKGTIIMLLARPPALDPARFEEPRAFLPERWLPGSRMGAHDASAHIPFGSGPRICPGRSLALLEMRVVLASLYHNFDVERVGQSADVKEVTAFTMAPSGLRVRLRRRRA